MIEKITDFESISGVSSPLFSLLYTDGVFSLGSLDGVFLQRAENGEITALFSMKNTCVNLVTLDNPDFSELKNFFEFSKVVSILSDTPLNMICNVQKEYSLLRFLGSQTFESGCVRLTSQSSTEEYKNIFALLSEKGDNFENWFTDFSRKINSENAKATYVCVDNKIVSCAVAPAVYKETSVVAGVYTLKEYRNKGYARECLKGLLNALSGGKIKEVYLWCEDDNIGFYEKLGFVNIGKVFIGEWV
ncbi:MAG: GNAT family N-acetyltransferase [Acutalibacteraceae bacterium]